MVTDQFIIETAEKAYAIGGMADALSAAFAFVKVVPEGWHLVPKEPTEEMCDVVHTYDSYSLSNNEAANVYRAMIAAAPKPA